MRCAECSRELPDGAAWCKWCGAVTVVNFAALVVSVLWAVSL